MDYNRGLVWEVRPTPPCTTPSYYHILQVCPDPGEGMCGHRGEWSHDKGPGRLHPWPQQVRGLWDRGWGTAQRTSQTLGQLRSRVWVTARVGPRASSCLTDGGHLAPATITPRSDLAAFSCSVKLNEHFLNTSDFLDTIQSNLHTALGRQ